MHWTISKQILSGYAVSLLFLLLLGGSTYQVSQKMLAAFEQRKQAFLIGDEADKLLSLVQDAETGQRGFLLTGLDPYLEPYNNATRLLPQALGNFKKLIASTPNAELMPELQSKVQEKIDELGETIDLRRNKGAEAALAVVLTQRGKAAMDRIREILATIRDSLTQEQEATSQRAQEASENMKWIILLGVPFAAILMLIAGLLTARQVSQPMSHMATAARRIASGNLDVEIPQLSRAEEVQALGMAFSSMVAALGQSARLSEKLASGDLTVQITPLSDADVVGKSQADMVAKLSDLIEQVQRSGVQVNSSALELAATSKQQQSTAGEMASTTTEISSTAKEMSATSTELLKAADNVNAISQQLAGLATGGKDGLARMELVMKQVIEASSSITARLGEMNDKAGNIGSVVTTITKIADQTNLLSLNAAIEAEKAGEYGRGFAVVAAEIRRLADQTAASTLDIEQMVREMLGSVSAGVMGMDKFSEEVRRSAREVSEVSGRIDQMIEQVQSLAPSVESVYEGMRAQTQGSGQISDALSQLGDAARQTSDAVRDSNRAVEQLNEAARGLHTAISRFKLR